MQNTMRAHSAGQISMDGGVDVNKGHMVYRWGHNTSLEQENLTRDTEQTFK